MGFPSSLTVVPQEMWSGGQQRRYSPSDNLKSQAARSTFSTGALMTQLQVTLESCISTKIVSFIFLPPLTSRIHSMSLAQASRPLDPAHSISALISAPIRHASPDT